MRDRVEQFRQTMPLIQDLKNKAMRQRHWDALRHEMSRDFDPYSPTFTLEQVFALGLHSQVRLQQRGLNMGGGWGMHAAGFTSV
jgi:hypothetical protein